MVSLASMVGMRRIFPHLVLDPLVKGTGSPYKVTTMLLTALPFCFYHIRKLFP